MTRPPCVSCIWWLLQPDIRTKSDLRLGQCRAESPRSMQRADGQMLTRWPLTIETDFCGDHEPGGEAA